MERASTGDPNIIIIQEDPRLCRRIRDLLVDYDPHCCSDAKDLSKATIAVETAVVVTEMHVL